MMKLKILVCALFALVAATLFCSASAAEIGTVAADSGLRLRSGASSSASTITVVENGAQLVVIEPGETWCKVNYAGTVGYMATEYLPHSTDAMFVSPIEGKITGSVVNFRAEANTDSEILSQLRENSIVTIIGFVNGWYHAMSDEVEGYIHPDYVSATTAYLPSAATVDIDAEPTPTAAVPATVSQTRTDLIAFAKQYVGTKYTYGGRSPSTGFDCSGFVYYVFKNFGYTLNPGASTQMDSVTVIKRAELVPGDLVFFNNGSARRASHVGIYVGGGQFIHATTPGNPLSINSLDSGYYSRYFVGGGRVLPLE